MIFLNGKYILEKDAKLKHNDRGFLLSDGIFETMRAYDGKISCVVNHYERLKKSAVYLNIPFVMSLREFINVANGLLEKNSLEERNCSLRVTLTRGTGQRGLLPPEKVIPTLMVSAFPFNSITPKPLKVIISKIHRNELSPLSNIKSLCYLDNIIARREATQQGADECILLNTKNNIACASVANIFIVTERGVITPQLEDGVLPGITRQLIIKICKENNFPIYEETISETDLMNAKEVFFTNRLIEIQPLVQINSKLVNGGKVGDIVSILQKLYKNSIENSFYVDNDQLPVDKISRFLSRSNL